MIERLYNTILLLFQSLASILKVILRSNLYPKKVVLNTDECYVLGNGPSLKNTLINHIEFLSTKELICVNKFPDTPEFTILKPKHFIICSSEFWASGTIDPNTQVRKDIIEALIAKTDWPLNFFLPYAAKNQKQFIEKITSNKHIRIVYYNTTAVEGLPSLSNLLFKWRLASPRPHNVLIPSLLNLINAGVKNIYLLGADHSWLPLIKVNDQNDVLVNQKHFYDADAAVYNKMYKRGIRPRKLHEVLEKFYYSFRSYHTLEVYAHSNNSRIINLTPNSYIDAFERSSIDQLID